MAADKLTSLHMEVERQSGACRQLAITLENYLVGNRLLLEGERVVLRGYSESLHTIADELTRALADSDQNAIGRLSGWAKVLAASLSIAIVTGGATGLTGSLIDDPQVISCVADLTAIDLDEAVDNAPEQSDSLAELERHVVELEMQSRIAVSSGRDGDLEARYNTVAGTGGSTIGAAGGPILELPDVAKLDELIGRLQTVRNTDHRSEWASRAAARMDPSPPR